MSFILALILNAGVTTNNPVYAFSYYKKEISFIDLTGLTRMCPVSGQYGIYFPGKLAFQAIDLSYCTTDTMFKSGYEIGEINKPGEL